MNKLSHISLASLALNSGAFVDGPFGSNLKASEYVDEGIPVLRLQNIRPNRYDPDNLKFISEKKAESLQRHTYQAGDVVITKLGEPCGVACQIPENTQSGIIVADVVRFRGDPSRIDHRYLVHFLNSPDGRCQVSQLTKGTTRQRVNLSDFKKIQIPLPPLEKQRRIAAILDKADAVRRKRKEAIALTEELLRSAFLDMFGDPVTNPKGWDKRKFKDIFKSIRYGTSTPPQFENDGIPFIRATNIKNGSVSVNDLRFISLDEANKIEKCKLKKGDIVIVRSGVNSGDSALIDEEYEGSYAGYDMIIDIDECFSIFYNFLINSEFGQQMIKPLTRRAGQPHINADQVKNLEFIYPSKISIREFNLLWHKAQLKINKYQKFQQQSDNLFNSLMQKAFRGEL